MDVRNVAIIAHVDHGKTTLVDQLLKQSGAFRENQAVAERAMDSNDLERERGITILAKATSVDWDGTRFNIVDTPGHADFGGEVERILSMVDGAVVLVDAAEGPMPQTKFVLGKALSVGLKPLVFVNKVDKPEQRAHEVHDEVFDLFAALDASEEQLEFPCLFGSAKQGWASEDPETPTGDMTALFKTIRERTPPPPVDADADFRMLVTLLDRDPFVGRLLTGRIESGSVAVGQTIKAINRDGEEIERGRVAKLLAFRGLERTPVETATAGDIVAIAGFQTTTVADTLGALEASEPLPARPIDPPTLSMSFSVNDSPLAGRDGDKLTSRVVADRLRRQAEGDVAIQIEESADKDGFEVFGRGELQMAVLIETMRREGFELSVGRPRVVYQQDDAGNRLEPIEEVTVDVDEEHSGVVVEKLSARKAELSEMRPAGAGKQRLVFLAPSRALIGYIGEFLTDTRGTGVLNRMFHGYAPYKGPIEGRRVGSLISMEQGDAVAYALWNLEDRGPLFIGAGEPVYGGMVIGEHNRGQDLEVNPLKSKQLTNVRASGKDESVDLTPPQRMTLERAIAYVADDELIEVTPNAVRLRKRWLDPHERKRRARQKAA